jgi:glycosyltransferase involved in cell wall biosynthesis
MADLNGSVNGAKMITRFMRDQFLEKKIDVIEFDTMPLTKGLFAYVLKRLYIVFRGIFFLVTHKSKHRVIYFPLAGGFFLYLQLILISASHFLGYLIVVHHHSYNYLRRDANLILRIPFLAMNRDIIHIFLSNDMKNNFEEKFYSVKNSKILENIKFANLRIAQLGLQKSNFKTSKIVSILHLGNLSVEKGLDSVLDIFEVLLEKFPNVHCHIAGPLTTDKCNTTIQRLIETYSNRFEILKEFSDLDLSIYLRESDFFLFPSRYRNEAAPLVVLEAQAAGLICFTSDIGSLEELVISPGFVSTSYSWKSDTEHFFENFFELDDDHQQNFLIEARTRIISISQSRDSAFDLELDQLVESLMKIECV